jgi:predicted AAA+ superfamily ATPase
MRDHRSFSEVRSNGDAWGRLVESCIGAHLMNSCFGTDIVVTYWRERGHEVDFVLQKGDAVTAIEVKSGRRQESLPGMEAFARAFPVKRRLLVGGQGIDLEEFLSKPASHWLS